MALEQYKAKRDFRKTAEPRPVVSTQSKHANRQPIFVVQEHHARQLHYDFRLETDGVLKSWAVPKGPSMDPRQKRLAVRVEDHPLRYATFHGVIPEGQYGAGTVKIWDKGTYENLLEEKPVPQTVSEGLEAGRLELVLHGEKLNGRFALIRIRSSGRGKENWLLIKMKDKFARLEGNSNGETTAKARTATKPTRRVARPEFAKGVGTVKSRTGMSFAESGRATGKFQSIKNQVHFSHVDKIMFPDDGITKADVLEFYIRIAPHLLPYLRDRPVTLERLPDGIDGADAPHFWQKHTPTYYPKWIPRIELPSERGEPVQYALVNDEQTLLYLANQGGLTFHVWFSRVENLDRPDFVLFDLDPGQASFADAVAVAKTLRAILKTEDHAAYIKTSGKTGLHVLVPWEADGGYDEARAWAMDVAKCVVAELPDSATVERSKAVRGKRVYVDVMQNAKGHHAVPPYVLRPVPGAPVSTPLNWKELTPDLDPKDFNLKTIFRRLSRQKHDPITALLRTFVK